MKISVCLVAPFPPPYGGIAHWTTLVNRRALDQLDVNFCLVDTAPRWRGTHQKSILLRAFGGGVQLIRDTWRLVKVLHRCKPAVVHLATSGGMAFVRDILFVYIARFFGAGTVVHIHYGRLGFMSPRSVEFRLFRHVAGSADRVLVIDKSTFASVSRFFVEEKIKCIPNCVDIDSLPKISKVKKAHKKSIVFLGWVVAEKGIEELLWAWSEIKSEDWNLLVIGPCAHTYKHSLIEKYSCDGVQFLGELAHSDAMSLLAQASLFVLPSYTEGFPNVVLEAMALGVPVIATSVGAIPEMLDGIGGSLVSAKDKVALKDALSDMVGDEERREKAGYAGMLRAKESYSLDVVFGLYLSEWNSIGNERALNGSKMK